MRANFVANCAYCHKDFSFKNRGGRARKFCCSSHKDMHYQQGDKGKIAKARADLRWRESESGKKYRAWYNSTNQRILSQRENRVRKAYGGNAIRALERSNYRCEVCLISIPEILQINHINPRANGGTDDLENLSVLCANCHQFVTINQKYVGFKKFKEADWRNLYFDFISLLRERYSGKD